MIAAVLGAAAAQAPAALAAPSETAAASGEARPVAGWSEFCARTPRECAFDPAEPPAIALAPKTRRLIASVNRWVNATVRSLADEEHWGVSDRWDLPADGFGDCEDYQLLKRKLLAEAGLPRRAMRMTVVVDEAGDGHAVLMIRTDRGDLILDNKTDDILPWHRTGYAFVKRESQSGAAAWVSLGAATAPSATAADPRGDLGAPPSTRQARLGASEAPGTASPAGVRPRRPACCKTRAPDARFRASDPSRARTPSAGTGP